MEVNTLILFCVHVLLEIETLQQIYSVLLISIQTDL